MMMKQWAALAGAALFAPYAAGQFNMLRFACSQLVVERTDPLVNPGMLYTPHLHQIVGGNAFNATMDPETYDMPGTSTCTSCSFAEDMSNYWTAVMFFKHSNGSYHRVKQVGNGGPQGRLENDGGLDVYYIPSGQVTAFAPVSLHPASITRSGHEEDVLSFLLSPFLLTNIRVSVCWLEMLPTLTPARSRSPTSAIVAGLARATPPSLVALLALDPTLSTSLPTRLAR